MPEAVESFLQQPLAESASPALQALWHAARGDWDAAHEAAQVGRDADSAWVHALLHREEGDDSNAAYWYRRAGRPVYRGGVAKERETMLATLLQEQTS